MQSEPQTPQKNSKSFPWVYLLPGAFTFLGCILGFLWASNRWLFSTMVIASLLTGWLIQTWWFEWQSNRTIVAQQPSNNPLKLTRILIMLLLFITWMVPLAILGFSNFVYLLFGVNTGLWLCMALNQRKIGRHSKAMNPR